MKKVIVIICLLIASQVHSQWQIQHVDPPHDAGSYISGTDIIYTGGHLSTIQKSTNGGLTWTELYLTNTPFSVWSLSFINSMTGYIGGGLTNMYKTTNGGVNFTDVSAGLLYTTVSVKAITSSIVYQTASLKVFKTTNGGANWVEKYNSPSSLIYGLEFINPNTGWIGLSSGEVLKTTNGGDNWATQVGDTMTDVQKIYFINSTTGFVVGRTSKILKTTNAGVNWSYMTVPGSYNLQDIVFTDSVTGFCNAYYQILKSTDAGLNWSLIYDNSDTYLKSIGKVSGSIVATGSTGDCIRSTNNGVNWTIIHDGIDGSLETVHFIDPTTGWAADDYYNVFRTTNGGNNWTRIFNGSNVDYEDIFFFNSNTGWALGNISGDGTFMRSTNGGLNWNEQTISDDDCVDGFFINMLTGWIIGEAPSSSINYTVKKTTNFGFTWDSVGVVSPAPTSIHFTNASTGYTAGDTLTIHKTTTGGTSWSRVFQAPNPGRMEFNSIFFIDPNTGWVCGDSGRVYKTTNAGLNWFAQSSGTMNDLYSVKFGSNVGCIVGENGTRLITINGGSNWTHENLGSARDLNDVWFKEPGTAVVVGDNEYISSRSTLVGIESPTNIGIPISHNLYQNYPNPFNPVTKIKFDIPYQSNSVTKLAIYDITGREVALLANQKLSPGSYEYSFDGVNLSSGIYYYKLQSGEFSETKKMVLIR